MARNLRKKKITQTSISKYSVSVLFLSFFITSALETNYCQDNNKEMFPAEASRVFASSACNSHQHEPVST